MINTIHIGIGFLLTDFNWLSPLEPSDIIKKSLSRILPRVDTGFPHILKINFHIYLYCRITPNVSSSLMYEEKATAVPMKWTQCVNFYNYKEYLGSSCDSSVVQL